MATDRSQEEVPARVVLAPGESVALRLAGLGPAGYLWHTDVEGPGEIVDLAWERGPAPSGGPRPAVGVGRPELLHITAAAPGRVTLHLTQRRPWETDVPPRTAYDIEVVVGEGDTG
jgi:predicted secreted protein